MVDVTKNTGNQINVVLKNETELRANPKNARTHSKKQIHKVAQSIEKFGFTTPVLIDKAGMIIAGHCRYLAAKQLGIKEIPTICLDHLSPEEIRAYAIADNKLALDAGWDEEVLKIELKELINLDFDIELTGFDIPEIDMIVLDSSNENQKKTDKSDEIDDIVNVPKVVEPGDIYQLGKHKLICGDSLKSETYERLLQGEKANIVFNDSPFNVKVNGHVCESGKHQEFAMASGEMTNDEFTNFLRTSMQNLVKYSTEGSIHFECMDWRHSKNMLDAAEGVYSELKNICVWDKGSGGMGSLYRSQHELVFVFKNGHSKHQNNVELGKHGRYRTNLWQYPGVRASNPNSLEDLKLHPTVKPVSMIMDAILDCSKPNDIILDNFGGSGSTLLAAERTKRRAYVIELEPHYCDVIIYRYKKLFPKNEVKLISKEKVEA